MNGISVKYDSKLNVFIPCWPLRLRKGDDFRLQQLRTPHLAGCSQMEDQGYWGSYGATRADNG